MKYELNAPVSTSKSIVEGLLESMGVKDPKRWIHAGRDELNDWRLLGEQNMVRAVELVRGVVEREENILIAADSDADGLTSAAEFVNLLWWDYPEYAERHISWLVHDGKKHGLADLMDLIDTNSISLVVCPDAGTADHEYHEILTDSGCRVLVLDHHPSACGVNENENVTTINVQYCDYPNKALTGAGVVWQFTRAYDELYPDYTTSGKSVGYSKHCMDLAAVGDIGDMADARELETRALVNVGLQRIENPFIEQLMIQNAFTMDKHGGVCYMGIAFAVVPFINAICRSGTIDEKRFVLESMFEMNRSKLVPSGKRGESGIDVPMAREAVRVALNVKRRQSDEQKTASEELEDIIDRFDLLSHKAIVAVSEGGVRPELAGLCANSLASKYKRPVLVLSVYDDVVRGSARCPDEVDVDFRDIVACFDGANYAAGHAHAFGAELPIQEVERFAAYLDGLLPEEGSSATQVAFVLNPRHDDVRRYVEALDSMASYWGQQLKEPSIAVEDINLSRCSIDLMSRDKNPTLKVTSLDGVQYMKFRSSVEEYERLVSCQRDVTMACIGTASINRYKDKETPQIIMDEVEFHEEWVF